MKRKPHFKYKLQLYCKHYRIAQGCNSFVIPFNTSPHVTWKEIPQINSFSFLFSFCFKMHRMQIGEHAFFFFGQISMQKD